ncbi:transmembrane protein 65-like [Haliotis rufescens]|uniref:transmembrane protein 65-like n=1 Tax=Haliotis rufescens TaxID=6454 RepID=UPI00201FA921|nr:transmembrane protein 65-like [Haliotis rufescens]
MSSLTANMCLRCVALASRRTTFRKFARIQMLTVPKVTVSLPMLAHSGYTPRFYDHQTARDLIYSLNQDQRNILLSEITQFEEERVKTLGLDPPVPPTSTQLRLLAFHNALPFIGFGFFDNFIMIVCGEYIDSTLGAVLGISTMAAAGLGNLISDVVGLGSASYVERLAAAAGVRAPALTPPQLDMKSTRRSSSFGKIFGISLGCLIGMFPLLFFHDDEKKTEEKSEGESTESSEQAK